MNIIIELAFYVHNLPFIKRTFVQFWSFALQLSSNHRITKKWSENTDIKGKWKINLDFSGKFLLKNFKMIFRDNHLGLHRTFVGTKVLDYTELTFPRFLDRYRPNRSVEMIPLRLVTFVYHPKNLLCLNFGADWRSLDNTFFRDKKFATFFSNSFNYLQLQ